VTQKAIDIAMLSTENRHQLYPHLTSRLTLIPTYIWRLTKIKGGEVTTEKKKHLSLQQKIKLAQGKGIVIDQKGKEVVLNVWQLIISAANTETCESVLRAINLHIKTRGPSISMMMRRQMFGNPKSKIQN